MKSRFVSVTGATGFLGRHIVDALLRGGWTVRAIVRPDSPNAAPEGADAVRAPLEPAALTGACSGSSLIVHAAGAVWAPNERTLSAVNVDGTRAVVTAANAVGARVIAISSQAAIGPGTPECPAREDDEPRPMTAYGRSKLAGEAVLRSDARVPWTILRPCAVYGPGDRQFLPLLRLASRGIFPSLSLPAAAFTLIHVADLARAVALAAESTDVDREALFIGHPDPQSADAFVRAAAAACGRVYRPLRVPRWALGIAARLGDGAGRFGKRFPLDSSGGFVCAVDRARDRLGFTAATSLADGLAATLRWYRDRRWL